MNILCKSGFHIWKKCKCLLCGQIRDEKHDWIECTCNSCGKKREHLLYSKADKLFCENCKKEFHDLKYIFQYLKNTSQQTYEYKNNIYETRIIQQIKNGQITDQYLLKEIYIEYCKRDNKDLRLIAMINIKDQRILEDLYEYFKPLPINSKERETFIYDLVNYSLLSESLCDHTYPKAIIYKITDDNLLERIAYDAVTFEFKNYYYHYENANIIWAAIRSIKSKEILTQIIQYEFENEYQIKEEIGHYISFQNRSSHKISNFDYLSLILKKAAYECIAAYEHEEDMGLIKEDIVLLEKYWKPNDIIFGSLFVAYRLGYESYLLEHALKGELEAVDYITNEKFLAKIALEGKGLSHKEINTRASSDMDREYFDVKGVKDEAVKKIKDSTLLEKIVKESIDSQIRDIASDKLRILNHKI